MDTRTPPSPTRGRVVAAAVIGNVMEWFDFSVYGLFAVSIGRTFFPSGSATVSLLATLAVYGVAFLVRPLGGVVIGSLGDRHGRRAALVLSVTLMGAATTVVGLLPSFASIGIAAPILLVALRCVQGFSAGGEWTGASAYVVEHAGSRRKALFASVVPASAAAAVTLGALVAVLVTTTLPPVAVDSWGWRVPFLAAFPLALGALYMRLRLADTPEFTSMRESGRVERSPLARVGRGHARTVLLTFVMAAVGGLGFYYLATYVPTFLVTVGGMALLPAYLVVAVGSAVYAGMCLLVGLLADRVGRRPTILAGSVGLVLAPVPVFALMASGSVAGALTGFVVFAVFEAMANVGGTVVLLELFPTGIRSTGSALGFNLSSALVAGPGPLVAAALAPLGTTVPAFYMVVVALVATPVVWRWLPETADREPGEFVRETGAEVMRERPQPKSVVLRLPGATRREEQ